MSARVLSSRLIEPKERFATLSGQGILPVQGEVLLRRSRLEKAKLQIVVD